MFGTLVRVFSRHGARDHLSARRAQEELDLHRLYLLTTFFKREGSAEAVVASVLKEAEGLKYEHLKAGVTANLTAQVFDACAAVRDAMSGHTARMSEMGGKNTRDAQQKHRSAVTKALHARLGFSLRVGPSSAGPGAGEGLFVRGRVDPGEIVAVYPGVTYALDALRLMPGYPKVRKGSRESAHHLSFAQRSESRRREVSAVSE